MSETPVAPLDFEAEVHEIELRIAAIHQDSRDSSPAELLGKSRELIKERDRKLKQLYAKLDAWQTCKVARHPQRPQAADYLHEGLDDFIGMHGDRMYGDDPAVIGGLAQLQGRSIMAIAQHKGSSTEDRIAHNFGMPMPEGYRKALRLAKLAAKFRLPVVTFIDTPGAYPGIEAEERGQAQAIGNCLLEMAVLETPIIAIVIGEGGSGGALALGVADEVMMLEHSIYSVISPEGCASILWRSAERAADAAAALNLTAGKLKKLDLIDTIIAEPIGGAHRDRTGTIGAVCKAAAATLDRLAGIDLQAIVQRRAARARNYGKFDGG
ncbi:MAG: acetyl-CoA carboxylase carboxyltransferase subunit alpha [Betaproteobacteria bacterium]|nr:acetyl-CoA carboxylase carboxyltransferase subunit alpha [Betaproteobacteria bacterium]